MTDRRLARALPAIAAALFALGACSSTPAPQQRGVSAASPSQSSPSSSNSSTGSPSGSPSAPAAARIRVRPAGFRLPTPLGREAVSSDGCTAVVAGGLVAGDASTAAASRIDLRTGHVSPLPSLPVPVHDTAGSLAGRPLVIGGGNAAEQSVVQAWDGRGWQVVGHLPQARSDLVAADVVGHVVVAGGYDGSRPAEPDVLSSADGRTWKVVGRLPVPVRYPASTVVDDTMWLFGGESSGASRNAIQRIDASGHVQLVGRLPTLLGHAVAVPFGTRILIAGGRTSADIITDRMWWFDTRTGRITAAGRLPSPLADSAVARCGDADYLLGGETPHVTDRVLRVTYR